MPGACGRSLHATNPLAHGFAATEITIIYLPFLSFVTIPRPFSPQGLSRAVPSAWNAFSSALHKADSSWPSGFTSNDISPGWPFPDCCSPFLQPVSFITSVHVFISLAAYLPHETVNLWEWNPRLFCSQGIPSTWHCQ